MQSALCRDISRGVETLSEKAFEARAFPELAALVEAFERGLKSRLGEPIEVTGDRVFFEWTEGRMRFRVILVRENGEWRVEDVKIAE